MADGNLEVIQSGYEAFGRGDVPTVLGIMSEDIEMNVPASVPQGAEVRGRDEAGEFFQRLGSLWEEFGIEVQDFVASGDRVCALGTANGRTNGRDVTYGFVHAWTMRDGTAVKFDEYVDVDPAAFA